MTEAKGNRVNARQKFGYWILWLGAATAVSAGINQIYWHTTRTITEKMEGGWSRVVIDHNIPWDDVFWPMLLVASLLVTFMYSAYLLITD